jgi:hypothetical protein
MNISTCCARYLSHRNLLDELRDLSKKEQEVGEQATARQSSDEGTTWQGTKRVLCAAILGLPICLRAKMVAEGLVKVRPEEDGVNSCREHLRGISPLSSRGDWGGKAVQCLLTVPTDA